VHAVSYLEPGCALEITGDWLHKHETFGPQAIEYESLVLDVTAVPKEGVVRHVNHHCQPNGAISYYRDDKGRPKLGYHVLRKVLIGDEFCAAYGKGYASKQDVSGLGGVGPASPGGLPGSNRSVRVSAGPSRAGSARA